jgi:hypothetical protein
VKFKAPIQISDLENSPKYNIVASSTKSREGNISSAPKSLSDQLLSYTFQFTPARFVVQCYYNPWHATTTSGLNVPLKHLIEHVIHAPAPSSLWDVQLIHPDPGGLDQLESAIESAVNGSGMKSRIYRALVQDLDYYDYLRDLVTRVRRFDYPPPALGYKPIFENLVTFLNYAATL